MTTTHDPATADRPRLRDRVRLTWWLLRFDVAMQDHPARVSRRPRWTGGAVLAGLIAILPPGYMWIAWQMGAFSAVAEMGGGTVDLSRLGVPATLTRTDDTISMHTTAGWGPVALSGALCLVAFALGSRSWRLWGGAA
ncbi:MAG: hypothetical protein IR158_17445 [Cellulomonas sp.]|uniref:hypothetical protein n=1 Tax=Cellulomonas sp. TaxID=40001 RepID=UPI0019F0D794|nr:hypothetical protein [Cellulomonas sp.]MBF0689538.1 hypothetical protein [Cellulomonas sp.]